MPFQSQTTTKTNIGSIKPYDKAVPYPPPYDVNAEINNTSLGREYLHNAIIVLNNQQVGVQWQVQATL
jgi:hypothetical protein